MMDDSSTGYDDEILVTPLTSDQLPMFAISPDDAAPLPAVAAWVDELIRAGETRPEWCFVAMAAGSVAGKLLYWSLPSKPEEFFIGSFRVRNSPEGFAIGNALLTRSLELMAAYPLRLLDARIQLPREPDPELKRRLFESAGLRLVQEKVHLVLDESSALPDQEWRLRYRSLADAGDELFASIIEEVTHGTLDRIDRRTMEQRGAHRAALDYMATLRDLHYDPTAWQLAFDDAGECVGLVVPQLLRPDLGAINYIGVVPARRGKGYGAELIRRGVHTLRSLYDVTRIVADTDTLNRPTRDGMLTMGFAEQGITEVYWKEWD